MTARTFSTLLAREDRLIARAASILERRFMTPRGRRLDSFKSARTFCAMRLARYHREVMVGIWMDAQMHVIAVEEFARGTITHVHLYPREIVRSALKHNAARLIIAHNHPGGGLEFSLADLELTTKLRAALKLIDVQIDDHFLVGNGVTSLTEFEINQQLARQRA